LATKTLNQAIQAAGGAVNLLKNSQIGPYAFPVVRTEYTNWRDEQRAWAESCALLDLSYHMTDMYLEGPGAAKLLEKLSVNSFKNFSVNQAKQLIICNEEGQVITDGILFHLDEHRFNVTGRPPVHNWIQYQLETGRHDAVATRDERVMDNSGRRKVFRFQIQGPNAAPLLKDVLKADPPEIKFFHIRPLKIGTRDIHALRHGMAGQAGWELYGPFEFGEEVKRALIDKGRSHGLREVGSRAYPSATLESGWIPSLVPAIYSNAGMSPYRDWLSENSYEGRASLGGSFESSEIADYYLTPFELGRGHVIKFDHEFIGDSALRDSNAEQSRRKVTLVWETEDLQKVFGSLCTDENYKYIDLPVANYATIPFDTVLSGEHVAGIATSSGYTFNKRAMISLGVVAPEYATPGTRLTLRWGEPSGGSSKPTVERHRQILVRVTVAPTPFSDVAREQYRRS
jgi:glycine cleavage system aminomethyltransferase T